MAFRALIISFLLITMGNLTAASPYDRVLAKKYLKTNPVILDCGAHNGTSAFIWKKCFPEATILAVEADPNVAKILFARVKKVAGIKPFGLVLSDIDGEVEFYQNVSGKGDAQGSIYKQSKNKKIWVWDVRVSDKPTRLPSRKLDTFCKENGISQIDFLFLDMQGGELKMLKSSTEILPKVSLICTEVSFDPVYEGVPLFPEVDAFMTSAGFARVRLIEYQGLQGDAYYVRKDLLK